MEYRHLLCLSPRRKPFMHEREARATMAQSATKLPAFTEATVFTQAATAPCLEPVRFSPQCDAPALNTHLGIADHLRLGLASSRLPPLFCPLPHQQCACVQAVTGLDNEPCTDFLSDVHVMCIMYNALFRKFKKFYRISLVCCQHSLVRSLTILRRHVVFPTPSRCTSCS
jgi:hypothetical protein